MGDSDNESDSSSSSSGSGSSSSSSSSSSATSSRRSSEREEEAPAARPQETEKSDIQDTGEKVEENKATVTKEKSVEKSEIPEDAAEEEAKPISQSAGVEKRQEEEAAAAAATAVPAEVNDAEKTGETVKAEIPGDGEEESAAGATEDQEAKPQVAAVKIEDGKEADPEPPAPETSDDTVKESPKDTTETVDPPPVDNHIEEGEITEVSWKNHNSVCWGRFGSLVRFHHNENDRPLTLFSLSERR